MRMFTNRSIFTKILICFIIVAAVSGYVGYVGVQNVQELSAGLTSVYEDQALPIYQASNMLALFYQMRADARDMILATDINDINNHLANVHKGISQINVLASDFSTLDLSAEIDEAFDIFIESRAAYNKSLERLYVLTRENRDEEAIALLNGEMHESAFAQAETLKNLMTLALKDAEAKVAANAERADKAVAAMLRLIVIAAALALILGIFISRLISKPIRKLVRAANSLADGDLNVTIDVGGKDEVGVLARAFVKMTDQMNYALSNIWTAAEQVASGSRQVSDSSMELSHGATEQASSIEQLTASLEEVSAQTKLNAGNANKANKIAESAKSNAVQGNEQMQELLTAMDEINIAATNISKVIRAIDEIAFQTNILSLNAAIEAARAGQYGKGFAVVAEEVRNLATRSSNAAKETTDMIETSKKKAKIGIQIADQTADALGKIVDSVSEVADLVGGIAIASTEQASAINQINEGVMLVSDVTQSNSATSEETAAASEELAGQAELLKSQVSRFKLKNMNHADFNLLDNEPVVADIDQILAESKTALLQKTKGFSKLLAGRKKQQAAEDISEKETAQAKNAGTALQGAAATTEPAIQLDEPAGKKADVSHQNAGKKSKIELSDKDFGKYS